MFHLVGQIILGLAVGVIAKPLMPGKGMGRVLGIAGTGLIGSLLGVFVGRSFLGTENNLAGWMVSMVGVLLALTLYRVVTGPRSAY
ncbi:MAG TPA: GlsB/YeaQ/YmgE family stress response membrane protein [Blastocatellia bacterium]|nr:GlsB/YeaQ/YmgE family stress response membrane protein [Blastocatellia bacterium]